MVVREDVSRDGVSREGPARLRVIPVRHVGRARWGGTVRAMRVLWTLLAATTRICLRYRVTGLAAEAGFFALLSLPPLLLGLIGSVGFVGRLMGTEVVADLRTQLRTLALSVLTQQSVTKVILPTFDEVLHGGRADIVSIGFLLSLWSGSRALNVYVDTISIMYGFGGRRGIVRTRALSFSLYVLMLVIGVLVVPLVLVGPAQIDRMLHALVPLRVDWSDWLYWPLVTVAAVVTLATLYHVATPHRPPWRRALPGALLALAIWLVASDVLRRVLAESIGGASIYGPLSAPIVVLIWLYFFAIAVLIGAALNAAMDEEYPARVPDRAGP